MDRHGHRSRDQRRDGLDEEGRHATALPLHRREKRVRRPEKVPGTVSVTLPQLHRQVVVCDRCPRLRVYCSDVARVKRRVFIDWDYWGKPVPGFGDPRARLWIIGLAPAAHGANRTGRVFTGDNSGNFLFAALHRAQFANQPTATSRDDGLKLTDCYISATARCAPPGNKPSRDEIAQCADFLDAEW